MRLDKSTENMLWGRMANGDQEARKRLIESNQPLVTSIVNQLKGIPLEYDDMMASGMIGLIQAVDSYDPAKAQFSTYATFVIKGQILKEAKWAGPGVRVPDLQWRVINKARRAATQREYDTVVQESGIDPGELRRLQNITQPCVSINTLTKDGGSLEDMLTSAGLPPSAELMDFVSEVVDNAPQPFKDALLHLQRRPTETKRSWSGSSARRLVQNAKAYFVAKLHKHILMGDGE